MPPEPEPPDFTPPVPDPVEAIAADQVAAHATDAHGQAHGHHAPLHTHCENCGTALQGPFCHKCGQHDFDVHRSFGHAVHDALENFFHFDTKLFRNTVTLLFRPGALSAAFNAGHRAAQMPPLRFYIFVSLVFFFVSFTGRHEEGGEGALPYGALAELRTDLADASAELRADPGDARKAEKVRLLQEKLQALESRLGTAAVLEIDEDTPARPAATDHAAAAPAAAEHPPAASKPKLTHKPITDSEFEHTLKEKADHALHHQHEFAEMFLHAIPKMLLVCLPFFALYTRFLFRKSGQVYLQHLVVALHFHTFIFLWVLCRNGWAGVADLASHTLHNWIYFACNAWLALYPLLMLRHLYGNSWKKTFAKTVLLALAYLGTLGCVFLAAAGIILFTL